MVEIDILDVLDESIIIVDENIKIRYYNSYSKKNFPKIENENYIFEIFEDHNSNEIKRLNAELINYNHGNKMEYVFNFDNKYFKVKFKPFKNKQIFIGIKKFEDDYFFNLLNSSGFGTVLTEPENQKVIFVNDSFCEFTGYSRNEVLGKNLNFLKVDNTDIQERKLIKDSLDKKVPVKVVVKNKKKNGEIFFNKVSISPVFNKQTNKLQFYFGAQNDVTKEIKDKLYFEAILNTSKSIIIVTDGYKIKKVNKRFFEITEFNDFEDFTSKHSCICELFIQKEPEYIMPEMYNKRWNDYVRENYSKTNKACILDKNRNERVFQIEISDKLTLYGDEVITFTEITILLKNRKLLQEQTKHAAMGEMIAMIAHQWRQPLTTLNTIYSKINILRKMHMLTDDEFDKSYEKSKNIIEHLSETINDFRNFFHKEEISEKVKLSKLINKSLNLLEINFRLTLIKIIINYENNIENLILNINTSKFTQVLLNLLKNSYDELNNKVIDEKFIKIELILEKDFLRIDIIDNAGGIPENIIQKIFEPYFSTKSKNGTGLGLYMSKIIIEEHLKGCLEVKNLKDGACFSIKLPKNLICE